MGSASGSAGQLKQISRSQIQDAPIVAANGWEGGGWWTVSGAPPAMAKPAARAASASLSLLVAVASGMSVSDTGKSSILDEVRVHNGADSKKVPATAAANVSWDR